MAKSNKAKKAPAKSKAKAGKKAPARKGKVSTPKVHPIEEEILKATGAKKRKKGEEDAEYLDRLVSSAADLDDDQWDDLSASAQQWFNAAAEAVNESEEIPSFDAELDEEDEEAEDDDQEDGDDDEDGEAIDVDDVTVGMEVTIYDEEEEVLAEGEVVKVLKGSIHVEDEDEEVTKVKKSDIDTIYELAEEEDEEGEEDEEDDADDDEAEGTEIEVDEIEEGMSVALYDDEEEVLAEGTVAKVLKGSIKVEDDDGEVTTVKKKQIDSALSFDEAEEEEEEDPDEEDEEEEEEDEPKGKKGKGGVTGAIQALCCEFPDLSEKKIAAKLKKAGIEANEKTLHITYAKVHKIVDQLREHGHIE